MLDDEGGKLSAVAESLAMWLDEEPDFCAIVDGSAGTDALAAPESKLTQQIRRHASTLQRQARARRLLMHRGTNVAHTAASEEAPIFDVQECTVNPEVGFISFLRKHKASGTDDGEEHICGSVVGGNIGSVLSSDFDGVDNAAFDIFDAMSPLEPKCEETKASQMEQFRARQEHDILEFVRYRNNSRNAKPSESFWAHNSVVPPSSSGDQCRTSIDRYVTDMSVNEANSQTRRGGKRSKRPGRVFNASDFSTYSIDQLKEACRTQGICDVGSKASLRRYLADPKSAKLAYDPNNKKSWSNDQLRVFMSLHGKKCNGNREALLQRAIDLSSAPPARNATKLKLYRSLTAGGLREEVKARGLPFQGKKDALIVRLMTDDRDMLEAVSELCD